MSVWYKRRTYDVTSIKMVGGSFAVYLDKQNLHTPKRKKVLLPTRKLANEVENEWCNQKGSIDPAQMPITRLVNSALDKVSEDFDSIVLDLLAYGDTDLVCYRAEGPQDLVLLQENNWDPILLWAKNELSVDLKTTQGINYLTQPSTSRQRLFDEINSYDVFELTGLYDLVAISGSILLALAVAKKRISPEEGIDLSFLDEDWQRKQWGEDEESIRNRSNKLTEFQIANKFLNLVR